jgi:hypothetical protein
MSPSFSWTVKVCRRRAVLVGVARVDQPAVLGARPDRDDAIGRQGRAVGDQPVDLALRAGGEDIDGVVLGNGDLLDRARRRVDPDQLGGVVAVDDPPQDAAGAADECRRGLRGAGQWEGLHLLGHRVQATHVRLATVGVHQVATSAVPDRSVVGDRQPERV